MDGTGGFIVLNSNSNIFRARHSCFETVLLTNGGKKMFYIIDVLVLDGKVVDDEGEVDISSVVLE